MTRRRSGEAQAALGRVSGGPMKHRLEPRGGSKGSYQWDAEADPVDIHEWCEKIVNGPAGLVSFFEHEAFADEPSLSDAAEFVVRALANPRCEGSRAVLDAIIAQRDKVKK